MINKNYIGASAPENRPTRNFRMSSTVEALPQGSSTITPGRYALA